MKIVSAAKRVLFPPVRKLTADGVRDRRALVALFGGAAGVTGLGAGKVLATPTALSSGPAPFTPQTPYLASGRILGASNADRWSDTYNIIRDNSADRSGATDISAIVVAAAAFGVRIVIPNGTYLVSAGAYITLTTDLWVTCEPNVVFIITANRDAFRFSAPSNGAGLPTTRKLDWRWEGGYFDQSGQSNSTSMPYTSIYPRNNVGPNATADGISMRPSYTSGGVVKSCARELRVENVEFFAGTHWQALVAGGDQALYLGEAENIKVDVSATGTGDCIVYLSDDGTGVVGRDAFIRAKCRNSFYGVTIKRGFQNAEVLVDADNCVGALSLNHLVGAQDGAIRVRGYATNCQQGVRADYCDIINVAALTVRTMGALLADGATTLDASIGNPIGVQVNGSNKVKIYHCDFEGFNPAYTKAICQSFSFNSFTEGSVGPVYCSYCDFSMNTVDGIHGPGTENTGGAAVSPNTFGPNRILNCDLPGVVSDAVAGPNEIRYVEATGALNPRQGIALPDGTATKGAIHRAADPTTNISFGPNSIFGYIAGVLALTLNATALIITRIVQTPVGTAAAPAYGFSAEAGLGLFRAGTGKLGVAVSSTETLEFQAAGTFALKPFVSVSTLGISAAGTTLATATALTADYNEVITVASGTGVRLPAYLNQGVQRVVVVNSGANTLNVWPAVSIMAIRILNGSTAAQAAGAAATLAVGAHAVFEIVSATLCYEAP